MSIAALTTTFTPSASCLATDNLWKVFTTCPGNDQCYYLLQGPPSTSDCLPTAFNDASTAYYSPAQCPSGYTPACSGTNIINDLTETMYTCCPTMRKFSCLTSKNPIYPFQDDFGCQSPFTERGSVQVTVSETYSTWEGIETYDQGGAMNAFAVQVRFQSTDFVSTTTSSTPTSSSATPAQSIPTTTSPTSTSTASPAPTNAHSGGLGAGAKAGIGVGVSVGAIALVAMLWLGYAWGKRRSEKRSNTAVQSEQAGMRTGYPETYAQNLNYYAGSMQTAAVHKALSQTQGHELHGESRIFQEMPSPPT